MTDDIASRSLSSRVVLLCLTDLELRDSAPAHTAAVVRATSERIDDVDADTLGKLTEAEVNRTLNRLEADGLVEMADRDDHSPTGKGRPAYSLAVEVETVLDALDSDDDVGRLAARVADRA